MNKTSMIFFNFMYYLNLIIIPLEKLFISTSSICLYGVIYPLYLYSKNRKYIELLRNNVQCSGVKFNEIPTNIRYAIDKNGMVCGQLYLKSTLCFLWFPHITYNFE